MRAAALVAMTAVCLTALVGNAAAKDWTDPAGRITFTTPAAWTMDNHNDATMTYLVVGTANNECQFLAIPRAETASASASAVHRAAGNPISAAAWVGVANGMTRLFNNQATLISQTVDTGGFWPIQRAEFSGPDHPLIHGAIQIRPGAEIWAFCLTYDGADPLATYETVIHSVATPQDAALQAASEQEDAARAAAPAAPAAPAGHQTPPPAHH